MVEKLVCYLKIKRLNPAKINPFLSETCIQFTGGPHSIKQNTNFNHQSKINLLQMSGVLMVAEKIDKS